MNPDDPRTIKRERAFERAYEEAHEELLDDLGREPTENELESRALDILDSLTDDCDARLDALRNGDE